MYEAIATAIEKATEQIKLIQKNARTNGDLIRPRWPIIVPKSP